MELKVRREGKKGQKVRVVEILHIVFLNYSLAIIFSVSLLFYGILKRLTSSLVFLCLLHLFYIYSQDFSFVRMNM